MWRLVSALLLGLTLTASLALAGPTQVLLEIKSRGGYRDARAPDPFLLIRVLSDGQIACHCDDDRRVAGRISEERLDQLRHAIEDSGFLELRGGTSKLKSWWRGKFMDTSTVAYLANVGEKRNLYRRSGLREPEPEALRRLRQLAEPLREELCGAEETAPEGTF